MSALNYLVFFILGCIANCSVTAQTINDTTTLTENHMKGYNKYVRPVANQSDAVRVNIALHALAIQEFDEVQETLSVVGIFCLYWNDARMVWNPADYNGVSYFLVSYTDVWVPDLILTNPSHEINTMGDDWQRVTYEDDGDAKWTPGNVLKTTCSVNVLYYPFDTQECAITFYPLGYNQREVLVTNLQNGIDFSFYSENGAWSVAGTSARNEILADGSQVTFTMKIKRKPAFVVVNVLLPILFLSLINVLVFILPVECGERVSYCITVLLSIAVFMTIVSDTLPKNSEPVPIIAHILMLEMILSSLTTLVVILNISFYYKPATTPVPTWLKTVMRLQCFYRNRKVSDQTQVNQVSDSATVETIIQDWQKEDMKASEENHVFGQIVENLDDDTSITWRDVSTFLDRIAFWVLLSSSSLSFVAFIVIALCNA